MRLELHPLVPDALLPVTATARTRADVPAGYGVQEQCLPFTAAAAAGLLIRAPFSFGWCRPDAVPAGARAFPPPRRDARLDAQAVFYVVDRPESSFAGNAFRLAPIAYRDPQGDTHTYTAVQPGLSFFDRDDQADMFKLHLPFVVRTPAEVDSLFVPPVNRTAPLELVVGLVESDWYATPVSLVARVPRSGALHVGAGDVVAQMLFLARASRRAEPVVPGTTSVERQRLDGDLLRWYAGHGADRGAYKTLARSRHGRLDASACPHARA